MRRWIYILLFLFVSLFVTTSCFKSYIPNIRAEDLSKYVVMGRVDKNNSIQSVNVSVTSSINNPKYIPVIECTVTISDDKGHTFPLNDQGDGDYKGRIDHRYMVQGAQFKVDINTPMGDHLESDYDQLHDVSQLDTVYYQLTSKEGYEVGKATPGIQFYIDMSGNHSDSKYYKWNVYETWEYHTVYPIEWYYDGVVHHVFPPDSSKMVCWKTLKIPEVYTLNTNNLSDNAFRKFPLNFVSNKTDRLNIMYSLLVEQVALSQKAYDFWEKMRQNNSRNGGLYETQPMIIQGNIHNLTHPDNEVLGFFSAVSTKQKRIFVSHVAGLKPYARLYRCYYQWPLPLRFLQPYEYPVYLAPAEGGGFSNTIYLTECVDCLFHGGMNVKPSFWPDKK